MAFFGAMPVTSELVAAGAAGAGVAAGVDELQPAIAASARDDAARMIFMSRIEIGSANPNGSMGLRA